VETVHARHSGLVWDVRAGKSLDQSYVAARSKTSKKEENEL
jgi:hypothetical protein